MTRPFLKITLLAGIILLAGLCGVGTCWWVGVRSVDAAQTFAVGTVMSLGSEWSAERLRDVGTQSFRDRNSVELLSSELSAMRADLGDIRRARITEWRVWTGTNGPTAEFQMELTFDKGRPTAAMRLRQEGGEWRVNDLRFQRKTRSP